MSPRQQSSSAAALRLGRRAGRVYNLHALSSRAYSLDPETGLWSPRDLRSRCAEMLLAFPISLLSILFFVLPVAAQDITRLGGDLSTDIVGHNAIQVAAPNTASAERMARQLSGFSVFHRFTSIEEGLGPRFVNTSCGGCHVQNGRGPSRLPGATENNSTMVVKVALRGLREDGSPRAVPGVGEQLRDHSTSGRRFFSVRLRWQLIDGKYPDGARYQLRRPKLSYQIQHLAQGKVVASLRMSPALIGLGLLESIPEDAIIALADPDDANKDGISGRPNYVPNRRSGGYSLGRFGFRASNPTVEQQTAAAAFNDIGVTSVLFPPRSGLPELSDDLLDRLVLYQRIPGVPMARAQNDPKVQRGKALFQEIGCSDCHRITLETGLSDAPELVHQVIHPFTDLLLHDMGSDLRDRRAEFQASGREWRTTPLWGLGFSETLSAVRPTYLHDGRARSVEEAILWHGGEARRARDAFRKTPATDRAALIAFLRSL